MHCEARGERESGKGYWGELLRLGGQEWRV